MKYSVNLPWPTSVLGVLSDASHPSLLFLPYFVIVSSGAQSLPSPWTSAQPDTQFS